MHKTTFVTCVEAGPLENQVLLLAHSLREFGGPYADEPILAVKPRFGPPLNPSTHRAFAELNVRFEAHSLAGHYSWYNNLNKCVSMEWAENNVDTPYITWIDGDIAFVRNPAGLIPDQEFGFIGRPGEGVMATNGDDENTAYWNRISEIVGAPYDNAALITMIPDGKTAYEYYQGGIYTYPVKEKLSRHHARYMKQIIDAHIASHWAGTFHYDQVAVSMAARQTNLPRLQYTQDHNCNFNTNSGAESDRARLETCSVFHYHGVFYPEHYDKAMGFIKDSLPADALKLIERYTPFHIELSPDRRLLRRVLRSLREPQVTRHKAKCTVY